MVAVERQKEGTIWAFRPAPFEIIFEDNKGEFEVYRVSDLKCHSKNM